MELKERIRKAREDKGLAQEIAAFYLGIHLNTYAGYEDGTALPKRGMVLGMEKLYGRKILNEGE